METHETAAETLAGLERVRGRVAAWAKAPLWRIAAWSLATGVMFASIGAPQPGSPGLFLGMGVIWACNVVQFRARVRPTHAWRTRARWSIVAYIAFIVIAGATALALIWDDTWTWVSAALGGVLAAATFIMMTALNSTLARPLDPDLNVPPSIDATLSDPVGLRLLAALADYRGHLESLLLEEVLERPDSEVGAVLPPLVAAGYAEFTSPDGGWGRSRVWLRATPEGRAAFEGHVAALRAATA
ncbi:MAG: hypothetical protein ACLGHM_05355 [Actinomycetes bacterium]